MRVRVRGGAVDRGVHPEPIVIDPARAHVQQALLAPLVRVGGRGRGRGRGRA